MPESISLLLGAGFSAPMGYPIGNRLNDLILGCDGTEFGFHSGGGLCINSQQQGKPKTVNRCSYDDYFDFCRLLIQHYHSNIKPFDYEEFYDYIIETAATDSSIEPIAKPFLSGSERAAFLVRQLPKIYNQIVGFYLKDGQGKGWYDNEPQTGGFRFPGYTGILNCLQHWGQSRIVNVHTLNHDLVFEQRLANTDWLNHEVCDGFEELGSPFYGDLDINSRHYKIRIEHYTEKYNQKFRIFKLHGSRDYGVYYSRSNADGVHYPETYIKTRYGVGFGEFYKEVKGADGNLKYEICHANYHADFLTGTTSKIERYTEPLLYKKLFEYFRKNLEEAEKLVIIGYGAKDSEVNRIILSHFDYKNKPCYIVDPYAGEHVLKLQQDVGAKLIPTLIENLDIQEFDN